MGGGHSTPALSSPQGPLLHHTKNTVETCMTAEELIRTRLNEHKRKYIQTGEAVHRIRKRECEIILGLLLARTDSAGVDGMVAVHPTGPETLSQNP